MAANNRKIGVFGGTFDPVHRCHLRLAEFVFDQGFLDQILFLPAANPPHKPKAIASFSHRIAMLKTALSGREKLSVSTLEARRRGPSYTVDSLRALQREYRNTRLFFLLGADSLVEIHLWHHFTEIFHLAALVVVARPGLDDEQCYRAIRKLPGNFQPGCYKWLWSGNDGAEIYYLQGFSCPVSSSGIRKQLQKGLRPQGIDPEVMLYIQKYGLYRND